MSERCTNSEIYADFGLQLSPRSHG